MMQDAKDPCYREKNSQNVPKDLVFLEIVILWTAGTKI